MTRASSQIATALVAAIFLVTACDPYGFGARRLESEAELRRLFEVFERTRVADGIGIVYAALAPGWYLFHWNET